MLASNHYSGIIRNMKCPKKSAVWASLFSGLHLLLCLNLQAGQPSPSQQNPDTNSIRIEEEKMTFRRVSPHHYGTERNDFFLLETEVTNEMYERFLKSTGRTKGDVELFREEKMREENMMKSGHFNFNTAAPVYDLSNPKLLWRNNVPPQGMGNFPVALITRGDAEAFCQWLTSRYSGLGRFRLPTVEEWLIAAYGSTRKYPWGNEWSFDIPCVSRSEKKQKTAPKPVKAHQRDKTPEGIYGLWGNVAEYVMDPTHFPSDTRWMGPSFKRYPSEGMFPFVPRNDWWGYVHNSASRQEDIGFRVLLEPKKPSLLFN